MLETLCEPDSILSGTDDSTVADSIECRNSVQSYQHVLLSNAPSVTDRNNSDSQLIRNL